MVCAQTLPLVTTLYVSLVHMFSVSLHVLFDVLGY